MSVVGVSPGSPEALNPRALQPVTLYTSQGASATPTANTDGSQNFAGGNGTSKSGPTNPVNTTTTPNSSASSAPLTVQTATAAGQLQAKATAGNVYGFNVVMGATAGFVMLFDSTTVPADGTVTPKKVYAIAANASLGVHWDVPRAFGSGINAVLSTTGPFTKTVVTSGNLGFISLDYV